MRRPVFLFSWLLAGHRPLAEVFASLVAFTLDIYEAAFPAQAVAVSFVSGLHLPGIAFGAEAALPAPVFAIGADDSGRLANHIPTLSSTI